MEFLAVTVFLLGMFAADKIDKRINLKIKERLGNSWRKHRLFFVVLHLLIWGTGLFVSLCAFKIVNGEVLNVWPIFKLVLFSLTFIFMAAMLCGGLTLFTEVWTFRNRKDILPENVRNEKMKNAIIYSFLVAAAAVGLFLEYKFWI